MNAVEKYREMAEVHSSIDYGDANSVKRGNQAADTLRSLGQDQLDLDELLKILSAAHISSLWAAHHLLEFHDLADDQRICAVQRIEVEISKGGATAMGERMFLTEMNEKR